MVKKKLQLFLVMLTALVLSVFTGWAQPLNGTYTIGGATPNYASVAAAVTALQNNGVNGPVTFNIRSGSYATSVIIPTITGANATNRITFRAESGRGQVTLTTAATSSANNFVIRFNNASFITFREITLSNTGTSFGTVFDFVGSSASDSIVNCLITGSTLTSTSINMSRIFANSVTGSNNVIANDSIVRGSYGIYQVGINNTRPVNTVISGNTMVNPFFGTMYVFNTNDLKVRNNISIVAGVGSFNGYYLYECDGALEVTGNSQTISGSTLTSFGLYMWYCNASNSQRGVITNNSFISNTTSSSYPFYLYYNSHDSISNNTINATTISSLIYVESSYMDSTTIQNNNITLTSQSGSVYPMYALTLNSGGRNNSYINNTWTCNTTTGWIYNYPLYYSDNCRYIGNTVNLTSTSSGGVLNYFLYNSNLTMHNNTINCSGGTTGTVYGAYVLNNTTYPNTTISNNRIRATSGTTGLVYGLWLNSLSGTNNVFNNTVFTRTNSTNYTVDVTNANTGTINFYNNTLCNAGIGSGTNFTLRSTTNPGNAASFTYRNNVIAKTSANGFPPLWIFDNVANIGDYNNITTPGTALASRNGINFNTVNAWRVATGNDMNSLSFDPAFNNPVTGDLTPNVNIPAVWSLNGRGVHIAGNSTDMLGNTRAVLPFTGVPDIGAYEVVPAAGVLPPVCVANPAVPAAGITQTFTFGQDTVATITWDAVTFPSVSPEVRQFTASVPTNILSLNPTHMYFYDSISLAGTFNYISNIYYKSPWMGTIASEPALRLAKRNGSSPWVGYPSTISGSNTARKFIFSPTTPPLNDYGIYTGIDVGNNASANAITNPAGFFCSDTYTVIARIRNAGNNVLNSVTVNWEVDGTPRPPINITTPIPVNNGTPGSNDLLVNLGPVTFGAAPVTIKVWTSLPNNTTDPVAGDDTVTSVLRAALQGTYTVGGTSPDFATPVAAINTLNQVGVCGPVTFNIRPGTYVGQAIINNFQGSSVANRVTFQAENGDANTVTISNTATSSANNYVIRLNSASNITFRNLTILSGTSTWGYVLVPTGTINNDSIVGCNIISSNLTSFQSSCIYSSNVVGSNFVVENSRLEGSYWPIYWFGASNNYYNNLVLQNSNIVNGYQYSTYFYYTNGLRIINNNITTNTPLTFTYGILAVFCNQSPQIVNNRITHPSGYLLYTDNFNGTATNRARIANNIVVGTSTTSSTCFGMYAFSNGFTDIHHNTISVNATGTNNYAGYFFLSTPNTDIRNNVFANYGNGPALYFWNNQGLNNRIDFNNYYTSATGSNPPLVWAAAVSGTISTSLAAWRTLLGQDFNSLSAEPGFVSSTNPVPDPNNPNCWAMNGRAMQLTNANSDINGIPRVTNRANGVPDLGAIEFEPATMPVACTAVPSVPAPGVTQNFIYGQNNVATVRWNTQLAITSPLQVRQYSGAIAPDNFQVVSQNKFPYFYTSMTPTGFGSTYDFDLTVNYYDTWLGTIPVENNMKLAHKFASAPWISYNEANSSTNATTNTIFAAGVTSFGNFTGIDDGVNFSANVKVVGSTVICNGGSVVLNASPISAGSTTYTYQWKLNGSDIPGAVNNTYTATTGGDYTVMITATSVTPNKTSESIPVSVTVLAPPMAIINANGPLTYCNGNNLTLDAGSVPGVSYQWQRNGVNIPGATNNTFNVTTAGSYTVMVRNVGCSTNSSATLVNAGPIMVELGSDITGCEVKNTPYILDAGYPGAKYLWSTGDTTQTIEVYNGSGVYSVTVDAGPNCIGSDQVNVALNPLPTANGISYIRNGNDYTFSPSGDKNANTFFWMFGDGTTSSNKSVFKNITGSMTVKLVIGNDCGKDTITMAQWATGINNTLAEGIEADVYPNPAKDNVKLTVKGARLKDVTVLNVLGEVVYRTELDGKDTEHNMNVSAMAAGRYIIRATTTEGVINKPFNVQ